MGGTTCTCQKWAVLQNITGQIADERPFFHIGFCIESRQWFTKASTVLGVSYDAQMVCKCNDV